MIGKILTGSALTLMVTGRKEPFTISRDHRIFEQVLKAAYAGDEKEVLRLIDVANTIKTVSSGKVTIRNGEVYVGDEIVHMLIAERILELNASGIDFSSMAKFLENLMLNPSFTSRQELYLFMENGNMPITDDGRFLAFKWVTNDYKDCHTRSVDNRPGQKLKMDRGSVDDNREHLCSNGYHVCTHAYTKFGERLMIVAINPKDVVSVPKDYDNAKMRCSEYEVLYEVSADDYVKMDGGVADISRPATNPNQVRDRNGRFTKE